MRSAMQRSPSSSGAHTLYREPSLEDMLTITPEHSLDAPIKVTPANPAGDLLQELLQNKEQAKSVQEEEIPEGELYPVCINCGRRHFGGTGKSAHAKAQADKIMAFLNAGKR